MSGRRTTRVFRHLLLAVGYGLLGVIIALVVVYLKSAASGPDLKPWHEAELDAEYTADSPVADLSPHQDRGRGSGPIGPCRYGHWRLHVSVHPRQLV